MIPDIALVVISAILVGITNAFKDASAISQLKKEWWNKGRSWKMKWKLTDTNVLIKNNKRQWWYLGIYKTKYVEKFPYSSTALVSLTDGWHLLQFIQFSIIHLCTSILLFSDVLNILISFIVMRLIFSVTFELIYKKILNR